MADRDPRQLVTAPSQWLDGAPFAVDLTDQGLQYVIPGCERLDGEATTTPQQLLKWLRRART
ncbi:hypothetical protein T8K17_01940 [Thalassobaculum sp. OXR-137]|uniref:hypothetical protein n=1 Tax=Thalassobaculum sp. OXR-137 TaxID=3100173 RepID=UPI002AC95967|nr:hypothetical protein [Thalassobaculum sp. OXR-137]WPZ33194.1 hypothetical protein T8K17_18370 [Thalassobaculum sp. OXR-137]WPZ34912.1 hypothetical protein T8K17_01940 [Thalassobaculum sp. OXR-137]